MKKYKKINKIKTIHTTPYFYTTQSKLLGVDYTDIVFVELMLENICTHIAI